jgi:hypothetical protein
MNSKVSSGAATQSEVDLFKRARAVPLSHGQMFGGEELTKDQVVKGVLADVRVELSEVKRELKEIFAKAPQTHAAMGEDARKSLGAFRKLRKNGGPVTRQQFEKL